ncbi:PP2C family protein-serine/threonine phosphatase [Auraticoccus monumenti]|uniref:Protein phosphatase n=1 Tax=Auraticoccus monumenti TaxID=675864 RepID=A0A1G6SNY0_9ACTN|nr:protein phosphatase 2C domain-containing protein [Auraticoccus monumenti]SDD18344.1 protein phosphatase [Auraticoccus monumenti]
MSLQLRYVAHSEIGLVRKNNQDSGYASPTMLVVADGMGGAAAGDLASAVAISEVKAADAELRLAAMAAEQEAAATPDDQTASPVADTLSGAEGEGVPVLPADLEDIDPIAPDDVTLALDEMLRVLADIVRRANDRIADLVAADHSLEGMGTTLDAGMFDGEHLALAHIGDSRVYLLRDGVMTRLTHDHSWVQSLVDDGRISPEEAAYHPHRSLLLKVLNGQPANDPDLSTHTMLPGDRLLFCSDGLCGLVDDAVMEPVLGGEDPEQALRELVAEAHSEGGIDNITIVIADLVETDPDTPLPEVMVLGAAGSTDIPDVAIRSRTIDLGDEEADGDQPGSDVPVAPPPSRTSTPRTARTPPDGDDESDRYALQAPPPRHRRVIRVVLTLLLAVVLVGGAATGAVLWGRTQYFVGPAEEQVAIYRGLPDTIGGVALNQVYEIQQTPIADLPLLYQDRVRSTIEARSLADARSTVAELASVSRDCIRQREERAQATESPTPRPTDTPPPEATASPSAGTSPSPDPGPLPEDGAC